MAKGFTVTAFAGKIGVSRDTIYAWAKEYPEFSDTLKRARAKQVLYWEQRLHKAGNKKGDATPVIFALKNACPDEWRDVQRLEHGGRGNEPIQVEHMSAEELRADLVRRGELGPDGRLIQQREP